jgi:hypothetical protein
VSCTHLPASRAAAQPCSCVRHRYRPPAAAGQSHTLRFHGTSTCSRTVQGMAAPQRLAFQAQWIDPSSGVQWSYQLFAHVPADAALPLELEMVRGAVCVGCRARRATRHASVLSTHPSPHAPTPTVRHQEQAPLPQARQVRQRAALAAVCGQPCGRVCAPATPDCLRRRGDPPRCRGAR